MVSLIRFLAGLFIGIIYVVGSGAIGYILFEQFGMLISLIIAGLVAAFILDLTAIINFPRAITYGLLTPQMTVLMGLGFLFAEKELALYFTDDFAYRSCVGNFDHKKGIKDCTFLLDKLDNTGSFVLKEIENTSGDYWLAEVLSYRGRHYIRDKKIDLGKADFSRALLLPEGAAVTVNNLAEAGFTRSDIFKRDYDRILDNMASDARCLAVASKLGKETDASNFSALVSSKNLDAIKLCRLSTGREEANCDVIVSGRMRSIISLSNRFYVDTPRDELHSDLRLCQSK